MSEYYTVSQYANIMGKDPGNIRRMLIKGTLPGEKLGNQWIIPKNCIYPTDKRLKNGEYKNWRKRKKLNSKHPSLLRKLYEMCEEISVAYSGIIAEAILYGSYARGQENAESDIDIILILKTGYTDDQYDKMTDITVNYELETGITFSIISIEESNYTEWKYTLPFYKNIDREGIVLWKSA